VKIPSDVLVPIEKLTRYLLVPREWDDKSKFLAQAGFSLEEPQELLREIRRLAAEAEAVEDGENEYGVFLRAAGTLRGPNGRALPVVTVWIRWHLDGRTRFVTLKPRREKTR
jgi:hypothetical protein